MWNVIIDFIAHPNLNEDQVITALDTISEFCYWPDATRELPTTAIFYIDAVNEKEATTRGFSQFEQYFKNNEVKRVATETICHEDAIARWEAGIQSLR